MSIPLLQAEGLGQSTDRSTSVQANTARRLLLRSEVDGFFALSGEQVQSLISTQQITIIRIQGEEHFDVRALDRLIEIYKTTAQRRAS